MVKLLNPAQNVQLSPSQLAQYASNAGFKGQALNKIVAISLAESGGNTQAYGDQNLGKSFGVLQVNQAAHGAAAQAALNPQYAFNYAYGLSKGGTNFRDWTVYKTGAYTQYLPQATAGAAQVGAANGVDVSGGSSANISGGTGTLTFGDNPSGSTYNPTGGATQGGTSAATGVYGSGAATAGGGFYGGGSDAPLTNPGGAVSSTGTTAGAPTFWSEAVSIAGGWLTRGLVIVVGVVILAIAVWSLVSKETGGNAEGPSASRRTLRALRAVETVPVE